MDPDPPAPDLGLNFFQKHFSRRPKQSTIVVISTLRVEDFEAKTVDANSVDQDPTAPDQGLHFFYIFF